MSTSEQNKINSLRERATHFFKLTCIDDNVVGLPEDEYLALTNCRFCGRKLHRRRHLFTDGEEGIIASGKRCPCCGTIYTTHRIMYVLAVACSPEKLILLYSKPITYDSYRPLKGYKTFLNRDDVIFIEGDHNTCINTLIEQRQQNNKGRIQRADPKIICSTKHGSDEKQNVKQKTIEINNHPVIRMSSVVVIDDMAKYSTNDYAIQVVSKVTGEIFAMIIQAGYKGELGHYFISKETYERLFVCGIPLCRLIKKKDYVDRMKQNDLDLKPQSILMDYGYSVAEQNQLSMLARHNILAMLIDADICSRRRVISYLKFFIQQRHSNQMMADAITRWENDIAFVEGYHKGALKKIWTKNLEIR